jgi:microcompartment protein CcmL/EutN
MHALGIIEVKYMVIFGGEVADVEESLKEGQRVASDMLVSDLFLSHIHESILPAISGTTKIEKFGSLGIIETFSVASCVRAADKAAKMTPIEITEIRLANGLGGKCYFVFTGELADVEASLEAAKNSVKEEGLLAGCEIIPSPHKDLIDKGVYW